VLKVMVMVMGSSRIVVLFLSLLAIVAVQSKKLETVKDQELHKLLKSESYVVALFSKPNCKLCTELEHELAMTREVLVDSIGAWVVKVDSSPMAKLYTTSGEPAVVFFRKGVPLLYHGKPNEEDLLSTFQKSLEPAVRDLNDDNFEHLTQAATGATTGDWLVMFYRESCSLSSRLTATWEGVASELKGRLNVARVDKGLDGGATARRFEVSDTPTVLLFRQGKYYKYELDSYTIPDFVNFATNFYRNSKGTPVPPPKSPFDDFTEMIAEQLKENPLIVKVGSIVISVFMLLGVVIKFRGKKGGDAKKQK
jgi:thioredoxin-like negative regulator of GroEL